MNKKKSSKILFTNIYIGFQFGITVTLFVLGGYWLDNKYKQTPLFLTIGAAVGMIVAFYHLIKELHAAKKREDLQKNQEIDDRDSKENRKIKWM